MARYKIHYSIQLVHVLHCNILFILIHTNNTNRNRRNKNWKCKLNVTLKVTTYIPGNYENSPGIALILLYILLRKDKFAEHYRQINFFLFYRY